MMLALRCLVMACIGLVLLAGCGRTGSSPEAFVRSIYARFETPDAAAPEPGAVYSPVLADLIRADAGAAEGEAGLVDGDPLCSCQDSEGFQDLRLEVRPTGPSTADITACFRLSETPVTVYLSLLKTPAGWRVDDVRSAEQPSLKSMLTNQGGDP
jgi:hypothetical protein